MYKSSYVMQPFLKVLLRERAAGSSTCTDRSGGRKCSGRGFLTGRGRRAISTMLSRYGTVVTVTDEILKFGHFHIVVQLILVIVSLWISCTLSMVYKGCMIWKTRSIPYFDSFYPLFSPKKIHFLCVFPSLLSQRLEASLIFSEFW